MAKKKGTKLTFEEKIQIQNLLSDGKTVKEIGLEIARSIPAVQRYVNEFKQTISKIDVAHTPDQDMPQNNFIDLDMYNEAIKYMKMNGLAIETARSRLNATIAKLRSEPSSAEELAKAAIIRITPQEMMITKSVGGREGVTVMTEAASFRTDLNKSSKTKKRHNCLYNAKTGEPM